VNKPPPSGSRVDQRSPTCSPVRTTGRPKRRPSRVTALRPTPLSRQERVDDGNERLNVSARTNPARVQTTIPAHRVRHETSHGALTTSSDAPATKATGASAANYKCRRRPPRTGPRAADTPRNHYPPRAALAPCLRGPDSPREQKPPEHPPTACAVTAMKTPSRSPTTPDDVAAERPPTASRREARSFPLPNRAQRLAQRLPRRASARSRG